MTKTEIIAKIEDLYEQLRDNEYNSWYNRTTFTSWENSYEYTRYSELNAEQEKLVIELEKALVAEKKELQERLARIEELEKSKE